MLNLHTKSHSRENRPDTFSKVGIFSLSLLAATAIAYIYSPVLGSHAEEAGPNVKLNVGGVVGIRANLDELDLTAASGTFVSAPVNVDVTSNSFYGYTLSLEDVDSNTNMVSTEVSDVVSSGFSGSKTSSTMADNNWGYSLDNTNFYAIPVNGSPVAIKRTNSIMTTTYETTPVYFGIKVGMHLPATTYADVVRFTAYVNGVDREPLNKTTTVDDNPKITLHDISTMQDMRPTVCANTTTPLYTSTDLDTDGSHHGDTAYVPSVTLTDTRDGNTYTVRKLADGHCWMTDNLEIQNKTITPADSDVTKNFTIPASDINAFSLDYFAPAVYVDSGYSGYYNFYTATAGWGTTDIISGETPQSICPRGWKLPTVIGSSSDRYVLDLAYSYGQVSLLRGIPNYIFSGRADLWGKKVELKDREGWYWSAEVKDEYMAKAIEIDSTGFYEAATAKISGNTVRCIAR